MARWRAASTRSDGSAALVRDAREHVLAVVFAGVQHRPAALEVDGVDEILGGGSARARSSSRTAVVQRAEPSRRLGGTPQRSHDGGVAPRRRAHQVLGDALIVHPASARSAAARPCSRRRPPVRSPRAPPPPRPDA